MNFPFPQYIQLYPTVKCNQKCSFCFNPKGSPVPDLTFQKALLLLDILSENRIAEVDIMGGEPMLLHWMADFVLRGSSRGISMNISSNGSKPEAFVVFRDVPWSRVNVGISIEGSTEKKHNRITGSANFTSAMKSIENLCCLSRDPIVKTVLNRETADDIQNIIDLVRGMGVKRYYLIHMDLFDKAPGDGKFIFDYGSFLEFYRKIKTDNPDVGVHSVSASCFDKSSLPPGTRCAAGIRKLSILPDGTVFPCNLFHGMQEFALGNIFTDRLADIWSHPKLAFFRSHHENRCQLSACPHHDSCTGGCPAHSFYYYGKPEMTDIRCLRAFLRGQFRRTGK